MNAMIVNPVSDFGEEKIDDDGVMQPIGESTLGSNEAGSCPSPTPAHSPSRMPMAHVGVLAVVDESGHVVPIYTAADLLRQFKTIWQAE